MLEIKDISVKLKNSDNYLIKKITLYVKDGRLVPKTKLTNLERQTLFDYVNHQCNYEIEIGKVLYNGEDVKKIVDVSKKEKLMSTVRQIQDKKNDSVSNFVCKKAFSKEKPKILRREESLVVSYDNENFDGNVLKFIGRPLNDNGFTLIELIATISILAILSLIAVPNVVGVVEKNKNKTYLEDAKRMISLAEYKVNSSSANKPGSGGIKCFFISNLGTDEFSTEDGKAPNGGKYDMEKSYVMVTNEYDYSGYKMEYYVQLMEEKGKNYFGIAKTSKEKLYNGSLSDLIKKSKSPFESKCIEAIGSDNNGSIGGDTSGSDTRPGYNDNDQGLTEIKLDIVKKNFNSCGDEPIESWFLSKNKCSDKKIKDEIVLEVRGVGSNLQYHSCADDWVTKIPVKFIKNNVVEGQIYATSVLVDDYFSVKVPLDCSDENFKKASGDMILEFPGYQISNSDESVYNQAEQFWVGRKISKSSSN